MAPVSHSAEINNQPPKREGQWSHGKPPNEQLVEVEWEGVIIRVRAMWGRNGMLPHWESEDRDTLWRVSAFERWRSISDGTL